MYWIFNAAIPFHSTLFIQSRLCLVALQKPRVWPQRPSSLIPADLGSVHHFGFLYKMLYLTMIVFLDFCLLIDVRVEDKDHYQQYKPEQWPHLHLFLLLFSDKYSQKSAFSNNLKSSQSFHVHVFSPAWWHTFSSPFLRSRHASLLKPKLLLSRKQQLCYWSRETF